jgi:hypothetical protein
MSETARTGTRVAEHNVVATYDSPEDARAALVLLERKGIEGGDIELFGPGVDKTRRPITDVEQRRVDLQMATGLGRRILPAMVVGAVVLAVIGGALGRAVFGGNMGMTLAAVGGGVIGAWLGMLLAGYSGITANEEWGDTFGTDGETSVAVHSAHEAEIATALEVLKRTHAKRLALYDRDGQLRVVA